jgi:hypothetical protein
MVKIFRRILNRRYKGKDREYARYLLEFPAKLNGKLASHSGKVFDEIEIASTETVTKEVLNIALVRKKIEPTGDSTAAT